MIAQGTGCHVFLVMKGLLTSADIKADQSFPLKRKKPTDILAEKITVLFHNHNLQVQ